MFSYRHSLNGREAAAHLRVWANEHYASSTQLYDEMYTEVITWLRDLSSYPSFIPICTDILSNSRKNCKPGLELEDEENRV